MKKRKIIKHDIEYNLRASLSYKLEPEVRSKINEVVIENGLYLYGRRMRTCVYFLLNETLIDISGLDNDF